MILANPAKPSLLPCFNAQCRNAVHLGAIRDATVVFPPSWLLTVPEEIRCREMVVDADFSAPQSGDVFLSHVRASAIEAVCLLMIDSLDLETLMQIIPRRRFVGMDNRPLRDAGASE